MRAHLALALQKVRGEEDGIVANIVHVEAEIEKEVKIEVEVKVEVQVKVKVQVGVVEGFKMEARGGEKEKSAFHLRRRSHRRRRRSRHPLEALHPAVWMKQTKKILVIPKINPIHQQRT